MKYEINVKKLENPKGNVMGYANLVFEECLKVTRIAIVKNKEGELFVSMPSYKTNQVDEQGKAIYQDLIYPVTKDFREKLFGEVKASYEEQKSKKQDAIKSDLGKNEGKTETQRDTLFR